jgi:hypothetical protein
MPPLEKRLVMAGMTKRFRRTHSPSVNGLNNGVANAGGEVILNRDSIRAFKIYYLYGFNRFNNFVNRSAVAIRLRGPT